MEPIIIYSKGIVAMSICVKKDLTISHIEKEVNKMSPSGISSTWKISNDKTFKGGEPNPCVCEEHGNRLHYLLNC